MRSPFRLTAFLRSHTTLLTTATTTAVASPTATIHSPHSPPTTNGTRAAAPQRRLSGPLPPPLALSRLSCDTSRCDGFARNKFRSPRSRLFCRSDLYAAERHGCLSCMPARVFSSRCITLFFGISACRCAAISLFSPPPAALADVATPTPFHRVTLDGWNSRTTLASPLPRWFLAWRCRFPPATGTGLFFTVPNLAPADIPCYDCYRFHRRPSHTRCRLATLPFMPAHLTPYLAPHHRYRCLRHSTIAPALYCRCTASRARLLLYVPAHRAL